jgi:hypothetical protein
MWPANCCAKSSDLRFVRQPQESDIRGRLGPSDFKAACEKRDMKLSSNLPALDALNAGTSALYGNAAKSFR